MGTCECESVEIFCCFCLEDVWPHLIKHGTELVIHLGEEDRLIDVGGVLEGDKLHGIAVLGL